MRQILQLGRVSFTGWRSRACGEWLDFKPGFSRLSEELEVPEGVCVIMAWAPARHLEPQKHLPGREVLPHNSQSCVHAEGVHHSLEGTQSTHLSFKAHDLQLFVFQGADAKTVN